MKNKNLILMLLILFVVSCTKSWKETDRQEFINDCGITQGTEEMCLCILNCLESEYESYESALNNIPTSKVNSDFKDCLNKCE